MTNPALYRSITDADAARWPHLVQWVEGLGWRPRVAGGATDDEGEGSEGEDSETEQSKNDDGDTGGDEQKDQPDIDAIVQKRLGQARKQWEKDAAAAAEKAKMTEADRLKAEKAEAEKAAEERTSAANARVIRAEAKVAAVAAGVKPDRAAKFLKLLDLDGVELDDQGDPDGKAIAAAIKSTLDDFPEFKGTATKGASGGEHGDEPKTKPTSLASAVANHYA
jgi:hypothetical protein